MSFLNLDDARCTFCVGYLTALGEGESGAPLDAAYVADLLEGTGSARVVSCVVEWPSEQAGGPLLHVAGQAPMLLEARTLRAFAQGAVSALVVIDADERGEPRLVLKKRHAPGLSYIQSVLGLPEPDQCGWTGLAALDVLGRVLNEAPGSLPSIARTFEKWCVQISCLTEKPSRDERLLVQLVHPDARLPEKEHISDSGYDLTLLYEKKRFGRTILYGTGVVVEAPFGWYFDVVPRSSIIKRGHILANSVGVIDRSYRGEIFVPLIKINETAPDLSLPARVVQLIPRPIVHFPVEQKVALSATGRGAGGFGSTGE